MNAITTKYLCPTNTKGSRVKADDGCGSTITISWDDSGSSEYNHQAALRALLVKCNWAARGEKYLGDGLYRAGQKVGMVWFPALTAVMASRNDAPARR